MESQNPVIGIGTVMEMGDEVVTVKAITSRTDEHGKTIPYVRVAGKNGGLLDVPGSFIEQAIK